MKWFTIGKVSKMRLFSSNPGWNWHLETCIRPVSKSASWKLGMYTEIVVRLKYVFRRYYWLILYPTFP
jgi:hypothetical protein